MLLLNQPIVYFNLRLLSVRINHRYYSQNASPIENRIFAHTWFDTDCI